MTDKLTQHFSLPELTRTDTGLDNTPSNAIVDNLYKLAMTLEGVRSACYSMPVRISSGYRSAALNSTVGGSATSDHVNGLAADFTVDGLDLVDIMNAIIDAGIKFDQLILEPSWVHIGVGSRMRQQALYTRDRSNYFEYIRQGN
jgi:uncharacterized protein YcbK (DUF882 family)